MQAEQSDTVTVVPVFRWQCLKCQRINFSEGMPVDDEQMKEVQQQVALLYGDPSGPPRGMLEKPFEECHTEFFTEQTVF